MEKRNPTVEDFENGVKFARYYLNIGPEKIELVYHGEVSIRKDRNYENYDIDNWNIKRLELGKYRMQSMSHGYTSGYIYEYASTPNHAEIAMEEAHRIHRQTMDIIDKMLSVLQAQEITLTTLEERKGKK